MSGAARPTEDKPARDFAAILSCARGIADRLFEPNANEVDQADNPPASNIRALIDSGLMGLTTPSQYGGIGASDAVLRAFTEILAAACGVTTFVQGQHQSAALLIAGGENSGLKQWILPRMASGKVLCGVAFSHLRRPGNPVMRAKPDGDSWVLNGVAPWATGWPLLRETVMGATLPDGRLLYVVAPLAENEWMEISAPMSLCAMNASGTVSVTCRDLRIGPERYMKTISREQMARNDVAAILAVTAQPFGVACASIRLIRSLAESRDDSLLDHVANTLESEVESVRRDVESWMDRTAEMGFKEIALRIRARAIEAGVRAAHAALAASGGAANNRAHTAQRLLREAMFYTLTAQTPDVRSATLELLAERSAEAAATHVRPPESVKLDDGIR